VERLDPDKYTPDQWLEELNAPVRRGSSDKVSQAEVDDEMALFRQAQGVLR